ncbi:hypothetical protein [Paenibacillus ginsengihumi]|uniref:hypothetical protein n=1 Tax=Paenibacillus ginsengihumi TaxID=431596 RepID=UPI000362DBDD|nr:hypothetical protein [Paenibacillus ginsengihumi]
MLRNRSLLSGLGFGVILGALLLQLMNAAGHSGGLPPAEQAPQPEELDMKQLKETAAQYYQLFEKGETVYTQQQVDELLAQRLQEEKDRHAAELAAQAAARPDTIIYVAKGQEVWQVGEMLVKSGLIAERKDFEDKMYAKRLHNKMVPGAHAFKESMELDQIIAELTGR